VYVQYFIPMFPRMSRSQSHISGGRESFSHLSDRQVLSYPTLIFLPAYLSYGRHTYPPPLNSISIYYLFTYLPTTCLSICTSLLACLSADLHDYLLAHLPTCLPVCLPTVHTQPYCICTLHTYV
jgi:hypothetical protein